MASSLPLTIKPSSSIGASRACGGAEENKSSMSTMACLTYTADIGFSVQAKESGASIAMQRAAAICINVKHEILADRGLRMCPIIESTHSKSNVSSL